MKVEGSAVLGIERDRVWDALQDPAVLVRTIPGCERLEETGPDTYRMTVSAGVASIKGVYEGEVALSGHARPEGFVMRARGQGAPGTVDATVRVRLSEVDGGTRIDYDADAVVGGMIGGVGQRMLGSVAKRTAGEFFAAVETQLVAALQGTALPGTAVAPSGVIPLPGAAVIPFAEPDAASTANGTAQASSGRGQVYERQAVPVKEHTQVRPWVVLATFGAGAGVALASVAIGWVLGRATRPRRD
ncbi:carbon monoxide dehydrogenase subunit G [Nonomuraea sp. NPDC046570]|uniref:SRPBCC family protein n=1 Tax=Nonomuraea sp. NPDC046570 TaxID=3155255 RepID=UPI0034112271